MLFWKPPKHAPSEHTVEAAEHAAEPIPLDVIDVLIRAGSYSDALAQCRRMMVEAPVSRHRPLAYREALCLEALGRLKEAGAAYHRAEPQSGDRGAWAVAVLGQARCAVARGDLSTANDHLDRVAVRTGHPDCVATHIAEECQVLRARVEILGSGTVVAMDPLEPRGLAWPP
jgi:hypothetical protein